MDEIGKLHTCCKNCVFAEYKDKTQTGCKLGRIEKFGPSVVECKDENTEFFVINRLCNTFHDKSSEWAGKCKGDAEAVALKEARIKVAAIVYIGQDATVDGLKDTCRSLITVQGDYLPFQVFTINNQDTLKPSEIHATVWSVLENKVTWRISIPVRTEAGRVSKGRAVDIVVEPFKTGPDHPRYYTIFEAGSTAPPDFFKKIDDLVNIEMKQFIFISPFDNEENGVVCNVVAHQQMGGSQPWFSDTGDTITDLAEKLKAVAEANNSEHMILGSQCL